MTRIAQAFTEAEQRKPRVSEIAASEFGKSATLLFEGNLYRISIEVIDAERAQQYLLANAHNRPLSRYNVDRICSALGRNEWMLSGDTIVFDRAGMLVNGQHRLAAVVKSEVPLATFVIRGVDPEAFKVIDTCKPRAASDVLAVEKFPYYITLVGAARCVHAYMEGSPYQFDNVHFSNQLILDVVRQHPSLVKWAQATNHVKRLRFPVGFAAGLSYIYDLQGASHADIEEFWSRFVDGVGLTKESPIYHLRERVISTREGKLSIKRIALYAMTVKCLRAHLLKQPMKLLRNEVEPPIDL